MPQCALSFCVSRHEPEQSVRPAPHDVVHAPAEQTCPAMQARPHMPQWVRSLVRSRQVPEQTD
jgi:hypothetical protein